MSAVLTYAKLLFLQSDCSKGIFPKIQPPCHTNPWLSADLLISTLPYQHILYTKYAISFIINPSFLFVNHKFMKMITFCNNLSLPRKGCFPAFSSPTAKSPEASTRHFVLPLHIHTRVKCFCLFISSSFLLGGSSHIYKGF